MLICGIDEAGRGSLAGPVVAADVIFEKGYASQILFPMHHTQSVYRLASPVLCLA
jgi:hypothetical protein